MLDHVIDVWGGYGRRVPAAHRVFERDRWRCTVPGCSSLTNLHDHHIVFRSAGGSDDLVNRTTLCAWRHLRGVHGGSCDGLGRLPVTSASSSVSGRAPVPCSGLGLESGG